MSQQGRLSNGAVTATETLTGNTGGPVGPDGSGTINVIGSGHLSVAGNPGTFTLTISDDGTVPLQFTEDSGTAAPSGNNLNVFGDATQGSVTSGAGDTITITNSDATTTQKGVLETATDAEAIAVSATDKIITPSNLGPVFNAPPMIGSSVPNTGRFTRVDVDNIRLDTNTISTTDTNGDLILSPDGTGTVQIAYATEHAVPIFGASGAISEVGPLTNGQLVIGSTGAAPVAGAITSTGGTITVSLGAGTINLETDGSIAASFPTDAGTATPAAGALTVAGGTLMNTAGAASTVTINADDNVVGAVATDSGAVTPASNSFTITGGTGCSTSGATDTVTINVDDSIPAAFVTDSGTATPSGNSIDILGGTNINTAGAGDAVTINLDTNIDVGTIDCTQVTVDPGASGDSFVQFDINSTGEFRIGVDDDASDAFKISQGSALGTNDTQVITAAGEVTFPLTPTFFAYLAATESNVTGDGTNFIIGSSSGMTEVIDYNSDFSGYTFTAPVSGAYQLTGNFNLGGIGASHTVSYFQVVASNQTATVFGGDLSTQADSSGRLGVNISFLVNMDAADTAILRCQVDGSAKTVDVLHTGVLNPLTFISGSLQA